MLTESFRLASISGARYVDPVIDYTNGERNRKRCKPIFLEAVEEGPGLVLKQSISDRTS